MIEQFESSLMQFFGAIAWGKWISTLFLLILGIVLASFAARGVTRFMEDRASRHHTVMLRRLVFYIVLAIFFVAALREAGFSLDVVLGAAGYTDGCHWFCLPDVRLQHDQRAVPAGGKTL